MMQAFMWLVLMISSTMFMMMNHPLSMGFMLLLQTIMMTLITGFCAKSFWYSYILFLIFIGGMLVLFIYVTSLASNEMFSLSMKMLVSPMIIMMIMMPIIFILDKMMISTIFQNNDMNMNNEMEKMISEQSLSLIKLYNLPTNYINIMLMNYLLITMIASVKITNMFYGPLRVS